MTKQAGHRHGMVWNSPSTRITGSNAFVPGMILGRLIIADEVPSSAAIYTCYLVMLVNAEEICRICR